VEGAIIRGLGACFGLLRGFHLSESAKKMVTREFVVCRTSDQERARTQDLLDLIPKQGKIALDIGARDGHFSKLLAERFDRVVALDLERPDIDHPRIESVKGDACQLGFGDSAFDFVLCAEVLEHIPPDLLERVCREIVRVAGGVVVIGVPFKQDLRLGRTTCSSCRKTSASWGHMSSFDENRLIGLFEGLSLAKRSFVGAHKNSTNVFSAVLMDFAGNPYGTYEQEEHCPWCDSKLIRPIHRTVTQKIATKLAIVLNSIQRLFLRPRANWIHLRFEKANCERQERVPQ
jgi:hypothetical protein